MGMGHVVAPAPEGRTVPEIDLLAVAAATVAAFGSAAVYYGVLGGRLAAARQSVGLLQ